ncbi:hypothetical protein N2152v2_000165 [Parachlorella kessleri]
MADLWENLTYVVNMSELLWASAVMVLLLLGVHALFFGLTIQGVNGYQLFFQKDPALADYYVSYYRQWMFDKADTLDMAVGDVMFGSNPNKLVLPPTEEQRMLFVSDRTGISDSQFMRDNKEALANGLVQNLSFQKEVAKLKLNQQTKELVIFMVSEAGGLIPLCCLCLYVLLTLVQRARLKLFNVFLAVPRPVVMQLATKEVQVSFDDDEEGDDDDGEAWIRQQQQKEQIDAGSAGKGVGFSLTSAKRKLRSNGLAIYIMMVPFMLWCVVVCIVYAVSIVRLRGSNASVANLVGSQMLHYYCSVAFTQSVKIAWASSAAARATNQAL